MLRVILDSRLRLPLDSRVVRTANYDVIVFCCFAEEHKRQELEARGIMVEQVPMRQPFEDGTIPFPSAAAASNGRPDLERVMARLGEREITSLIIEGGAMVNWAALVGRNRGQDFLLLRSKDYRRNCFDPAGSGYGIPQDERSRLCAGASHCIVSAKTLRSKDICAILMRT